MEGHNNGTTTQDEWTARTIDGRTMYFHKDGGATRTRPEGL